MDKVSMAIGGLLIVAVLCLGGVIYLAAIGNPIPDVLVATAGASVGSLGTVLTLNRQSGP